VALTPRQWWSAVPDCDRPAWVQAARTGVLSADLAEVLDALGVVLARADSVAFMPPQLAEVILPW
jgi:hypothetical protein